MNAEHVFVDPYESVCTLSYNGHVRKLLVCCDGQERVRHVAKMCLLSYLGGPGRKIILRGHPPTDL